MKLGYMTFFSVDKCGLYKVSDENSYGCELDETLELITDWVNGKSLSSTMPWDEGTKKHFANCYCRDIYKDESSGDYLIVLWKSDSDNTGSLWGAHEDGAFGSGSVIKYNSKVKGKKVIWGRPCYYWVVPEYNTVVSLKFDNSLCDSGLFQEYIESAICNRAKHPNRSVEKTDKGFSRITFSDDENSYKYRYNFNMKLKSVDTANAELMKIVPKITHIIKRETIKINPKNERSDWINTFNSLIPFVSSKAKAKKRNIEIKAEAKPSVAEVRAIIEAHSSEERAKGSWDNVGFQTENGVAWVDKYRLRDIIHMPLDSSDIFAASEIYKRISEKRNEFLKPVAAKSRKKAEG